VAAERGYVRYVEADRISYVEETWLASGSRSQAGDTGVLGDDYWQFKTLRVQLNVTDISGLSAALDFFIEDTIDGVSWDQLAVTQSSITSAQQVIFNITIPFARTIRARWNITGTTPQVIFSVKTIAQG
jgi:hypothetical protein